MNKMVADKEFVNRCRFCGKIIKSTRTYCSNSCKTNYFRSKRELKINMTSPEVFIKKTLASINVKEDVVRRGVSVGDKIAFNKVINPSGLVTTQLSTSAPREMKQLKLKAKDVIRITVEVIYREPKNDDEGLS